MPWFKFQTESGVFTRFFPIKLSTVLAFLILSAGIAFSQAEQTPEEQDVQQQTAVMEILEGLKLEGVKAANRKLDGYTATLGTKNIEVTIFNTGSDEAPVWHIGFNANRFAFSDAYAREEAGDLEGLSVQQAYLIVSKEAAEGYPVNKLPEKVWKYIKNSLRTTDTVDLRKGVNFFASIDPSRSDLLTDLYDKLGIKKEPSGISGTLDDKTLGSLVNRKKGTTNKTNDSPLFLRAELPSIAPKDFAGLSSDPLVVTFAREGAQQDGTQGTAPKGSSKKPVKFTADTTVHTEVNEKELDFDVSLSVNRAPKPGENRLTMSGTLVGEAVEVVEQDFFTTKSLALRYEVDYKREVLVGLEGEADIYGKLVGFGIEGAFSKAAGNEMAVLIKPHLTLADISGGEIDVPGLNSAEFSGIRIARGYLEADVSIGDNLERIVLFKPAMQKMHVAVLHDQVSLGTYVPQPDSVPGTPPDTTLDEFVLNNVTMIYAPKDRVNSGPGSAAQPGAKGAPAKGGNTQTAGKGSGKGGTQTIPQRKLTGEQLPRPVAEQLMLAQAKKTRKEVKVDLHVGQVNLFGRMGIDTDKPVQPNEKEVSMLLKRSGVPSKKLYMQAHFDPRIFKKANPKQNLKKAEKNGILDTFQVDIPLPGFTPPGIGEFVSFSDGSLSLGSKQSPDGRRVITKGISTGIELTVEDNTIAFGGTISVEKYDPKKTKSGGAKGTGGAKPANLRRDILIKAYAADKDGWSKPFGIPWISMEDISLEMMFQGDAKDRKASYALHSTSVINDKPIKTIAELIVGKKKAKGASKGSGAKGIIDMRLKLTGELNVGKLKPMDQIPGIKEFSFKDVTISKSALAGTVVWGEKNLDTSMVIYRPPGAKSGATLMFRLKAMDFKDLIGAVEGTPLDSITFPDMVMAISTQPANSEPGGINGQVMAQLPEAVTNIFSGIMEDPNYTFQVPAKGIAVYTLFDPENCGDALKKALNTLISNQKLILAGSLGGIFGGPPSASLYATSTEKFTLPKGLPKFMRQQDIGGSFFMRFAKSGVAGKEVGVGVAMDMGVTIGDDDLTFGTEFSFDSSVAGTGIAVLGKMDGTWDEPFGLADLEMSNTRLKFGLKVDGSADVIIAGDSVMRDNTYNLKALVNVEPKALGIPKEVALKCDADVLGLESVMDFGQVLFRTAARTDEVMNTALAPIPEGDARNSVRKFIDNTSKSSLYDTLQLKYLPLFSFKKANITLVTPGASDPALPDMDTMGAAIKGDLEVMGYRFAEMNMYLKLTGLKIDGDVEFDFSKIGPFPRLADMGVNIDVSANMSETPRFIIQGDMDIIGIKGLADLQLTSDGMLIDLETMAGDLWKIAFIAQTKGKSLVDTHDFTVEGRLQSDFGEWLRKEVGKNALTAFNATDTAYKKAQKEIKKTKSSVDDLKKDLKIAKKEASKDFENARKKLQKARSKVKGFKKKYKKYKKKYKRAKWYNPKRGWYYAKYRTYQGCYYVADKTLVLLIKVLQVIPVELHPKVLAAAAKYGTAEAGYQIALGVLKGLEAANGAISSAIQSCINGIADADIFVVKDASFRGSFGDMQKGTPIKLKLDLRLAGQAVGFDTKINFKKPLESIDIEKIGKEFAKLLVGKHEDKGKSSDKGKKETKVSSKKEADKFIKDQYQKLLFRQPTSSWLKTYIDRMVEKGWTKERVIKELKDSKEYKKKREKQKYKKDEAEKIVKGFYHTLLCREADSGGLNHHAGKLERGESSQAEVYKTIKGSKEHKEKFTKKKYSKEKAENIVKDIYSRLLLREADLKGLRGYSESLIKGTRSLGSVHTSILFSTEYRNKHSRRKLEAEEADRSVNNLYRTLLRRKADSSGLAHYKSILVKGEKSYVEVYNTFVKSDEYKELHAK